MSTSDSLSDEPKWKKPKYNIISDHFESETFKNLVTNNWCNYKEIKTDQFEIITKPFRVCKISNFLDNKHFLKELKSELVGIKYTRTFTDLHKFEQSNDFKSVKKPNIERLYSTFQKEMTKWMKHVTKIELNNKISMSSSVYGNSDYLLCHDDNMGERKIAYILYLSSKWLPEYGGTLDLFDTDENGLPQNVVRSLLPEFNSLIFFEVTDNSFHQVAEVLTKEKPRLSINGWFEGPIIIPEKNRPPRPALPCNYIEPTDTEINLKSWINCLYMEEKNIKNIQKKIEKKSYLFVFKFLLDNVYDKLSNEIVSESISWRKLGPADERNYEIANETTLPRFLKNFYDMFKSKTFFDLLKSYTELDLVSIEPNMKPKMTIELQRWTHGCYTLIVDKSNNQQNIKNSELKEETRFDIALLESKKTTTSESCTDTDNKETDSSKESNNGKEFNNGQTSSSSNDSKYFKFSNQNKRSPSKTESMISHNSENSESTNYSTVSPNIGMRSKNISTCSANDECEDEQEIKNNKISKKIEPDMKWEGSVQESDISRDPDTSDDSSSELVNADDDNWKDHYTKETEEEQAYAEYEKEEYDEDIEEEELETEMDFEIETKDEDEDEDEDVDEDEDENEDEDGNKEGSLDLILQFHTKNTNPTYTIDYVKPNEKHGMCIQVPSRDNYLSLVYKTGNVTRVHKYVNHYCNDYFYNLICTYTE